MARVGSMSETFTRPCPNCEDWRYVPDPTERETCPLCKGDLYQCTVCELGITDCDCDHAGMELEMVNDLAHSQKGREQGTDNT
jgi:hypothetical protein